MTLMKFFAVVLVCAGSVLRLGAAPLVFDSDSASVGAQDGGGVWDGAGTNWWDGGANTNWSDGGVDSARFGAGSGAAGVVTISGVRSLESLVFDVAGSGNYLLAGGVLTFVNAPSVTGIVDAAISASLAGTEGLSKFGAGALTLSGTNPIAGGITVRGGSVQAMNSASALGDGPVNLAGGDLVLGAVEGVQQSLALSGWSADMIVEKAASFPLAGQNVSVSSWAFYEQGAPNSAHGLPSNGTITSAVNPSVVFQLQPFTSNNIILNSGRVTLATPGRFGQIQLLVDGQGTGGATYNVSLGFADGSTTTVSALTLPDWTVSGNNALVNFGLVTAASATWAGFYTNFLALIEQDITLSAADRRKVLVSVGIQNVQNNVMLLAASGLKESEYLNDLAVVSNGAVTVTAAGGAVLGNLSIGANTLAVNGTLQMGGAALSGEPDFAVAANGALIFTNAVSGGFGVTKSGAGTVWVSGTNSFTGNLTIGNGSVALLAGNAIPDGAGAGDVAVNGVLDLSGFNDGINGLSGTGAVDNATRAMVVTNLLTSTGLTTNWLTVGGNDAAVNFSGVVRNSLGNLALAKSGAGSMVLSSGNGHSGGTVVNGGTLQLAAAASPVMTVTNPRIWLDAADVFTNGTTLANGAAITDWFNKGTLGGLGTFTNASRTNTTLANNATFIATNTWFRNRPAVHFEATTDGAADWQALMNGVNFAGTNVTIFLVGRLSGTANFRMVGAMGNNWLMGSHNGSRGDLFMNNWVNDPAGNADPASYVYTAMKQGNLGYAWENGALRGVVSSGNTQGPDQWRLGGGYIGSNSEYSSCDIAEVLLFDRALTDAERVSVETYLMQKHLQQIPTLGGLALAAGTTVDFAGFSQNLGTLSGAGVVTNSGAAAHLGVSRATVSNEFSGQISGPLSLHKTGTGILTLGGALPNTYVGSNVVAQGAVYLTKPGGGALPGDLTFDNNLSPDVYTIYDNQLSPSSVITFITDAGDHGRFDLQGTTQTVAGIRTLGYATIRGVVQNRDAGPANTATSTLVLAGSGSYAFNGYLRNQTGRLGVTKTGSGTQVFSGAQITYTGPTLVNAGTLALSNATAFASATTISGATVRLLNTNNIGYGAGFTLAMQNGATLVHTASVAGASYITLAGMMTVAGSVTINQDSVNNAASVNKNLFLDGGLAGSGTITISALNPGNAVIFRNNNGAGFSGSIIVNGIASTVTNQGSGIGVGGCTTNLQYADITVNGTMELLNQGIGWAGNASFAFAMGGLNGSGVVIANHTSGGNTTLTLGNTNNPSGSYSGTLANGTGNILHLVKRGGGTQTFSGTNSYTGNTTIQGGTFALAGTAALLSTNIAVQSNSVLDVSGIGTLALGGLQTLELNGTVTGSVSTVAGSRIQPGRLGVIGTANFANDLSLAAGLTNTFELGGSTNIGGGINDLIAVAGTLTANTNRIVINFLAPPATGIYRLITCGTLVGGFDTNIVVGNLGRFAATLDQSTPGEINLVITGAGGDLVWAAYTNANWDLALANWSNVVTTLPDTFVNLDRVTFDDSGAASNIVTITTNVAPSWITVNSSVNYTFNQTGPGKISGVGGITKDGSGSLTFTIANENTGPLIISNGTVYVGSGGASGSLGGGTISMSGSGRLTYFRNGNIGTATNIFTGSGTVDFVGNGTSGSGSFSPIHLNAGSFGGTVNVVNARIVPANPQSLGAAVVNVTIGAINGQVYHTAAGTFTNQLNLAGIGWQEPTGFLGALRFQNATWSGPIVLTANARISPYSGAGTINGTIGGPFELELAGNNTLTLAPSSANTSASTRITGVLGAIIVVAGNSNALSTGPLVFSNGTLRLNGNSLSFASLATDPNIGGTIQNNHATIAATITVGGDNSSTAYGGTLANGAAAALGLTKVGAGTLTLTNNHTHTGATTVNGGTLSLGNSGTLSNSAQIIVAAGATLEVPAAGTFALVGFQSLEGSGLVTNNVTAAGSSRIRPGGTGTVATLTFADNLTIGSGTTNYFKLGTDPLAIGGGTNDLVTVGGTLTINGGVLEVAPVTTWSNGTYTLFQAASVTGAFSGVRNPTAQLLNLSLTYLTNAVLLVVGDRAGPLRWNSTNSLAWDQAASLNWFNQSTLLADLAFAGDALRFDDTPGVTTNVQLTGSPSPSLVTIDAATNTFVFGGSGTLTSLPLLVKSGAGLAIITNNSFNASLTIISNGTLQIGAGTNTGFLGGPISNNATLAYFRSVNSTTLTNVHSGGGTTLFNGTGKTNESDYILTADNSALTGPIFVNNARLRDSGSTTNERVFGADATVINVNTAGQVFAFGTNVTYGQKLSLAGNGWLEAGGPFGSLRLAVGANWSGEITLSNNASIGANTAQSGTVSGAISGPFALSKIAAGFVTLGGTSAVTVPRIIANNGTLWFSKTGLPAAPAGSVVQMGGGNTAQPNLRMGSSGQLGEGVVMVTSNTFNNWSRFDLMGTTQSLAGINDTLGGLVIQNGGSGTYATNEAMLVISNATDNTLLSHIRDFDNINGGGRLAITKNGAGTLTIGPVPSTGARASYSGDTSVNAGTLKLDAANAWASRILNASTVELYSASGNWNLPATARLAGNGVYLKTGPGTNSLLNLTNSAGGLIRVEQGTLRNDGNLCNWSNVTADLSINTNALFDARADSVFLDALSGGGNFTNSFGNGASNFDLVVIGVANGSGIFNGRLQDGGTGGNGENRGSVSLVKNGTGTQTFNNAVQILGEVLLNAGKLIVNSNLVTPAQLRIAAGTEFIGNASVGAITNDGTFTPGAPFAQINIASTYTETTNAILNLELGGTSAGVNHDYVSAAAVATLAGTLNVTLANGFAPADGDSFLLISGSALSGDFGATNLPALPNGQGWSYQNFGNAILLSATGTPVAATGYTAYSNLHALVLGETGDDDSDGYANLYEYVTGSNPTNGSSANALTSARTNGLFALKFLRDTNSVDATLIVEGAYSAANDADWIGFATNIAGSWGSATNVIEDANNPANVTAYDIASAATNRFLRLRITRP